MRTLAVLLMIVTLISANAWAQNDLSDAAKVKDYYSEWLSSLPGVKSVDVGMSPDGKPQIQVHTDATTPRPIDLPDQLNGIPVAVMTDPPEGDDSSTPPLPQPDER
jgi:hypothetical protein